MANTRLASLPNSSDNRAHSGGVIVAGVKGGGRRVLRTNHQNTRTPLHDTYERKRDDNGIRSYYAMILTHNLLSTTSLNMGDVDN